MGRISRRAFHGALASAFACSAIPAAWADPNRQISVALLMSGVITDGGWSQLAYNGLKELKARYGFKTAYAENISLAQMDQVSARLLRRRLRSGHRARRRIQQHPARSGARLSRANIISSRLSFRSRTCPATSCTSTWATSAPRTAPAFWPRSFQKRNSAVGFIGGDDDPNQQRMKRAFIAGAQQTVPGIRALAIITGDYDNASKGREAASILIGNGADVIWHAADVTGLGAIQGAVAGNVKVMGCYSDQTDLAPNNMATSFEMNLGRNGDQRRARCGGRHFCRRHRVAASRQSDVAAEVRQERGL